MINNFITFEGIDGSGKTTQIELLSKYLSNKNIENNIIREPGGTNISENIRGILLDKKNNISFESETLLFAAARSQLVNEIIEPKLTKNIVVLCDRYIDSTLAYQGYGRGVDKDLIIKINKFATNNLLPKITLIFDLDSKEAKERLKQKNVDRMELLDIEFYDKVRNGYLEIAKLNKDRCYIIDCNNQSIMDIHLKIIDILEKFI